MKGIATAGLVVIVLVTIGLAAVAWTIPAGGPPARPVPANTVLEIDSIDDLARLSEDDLRRLVEAGGEVEIRDLGRDGDQGLDEMSEGIRALDQAFVVPPVRSRSGTSSSGGSARRRTAPSRPPKSRTSP